MISQAYCSILAIADVEGVVSLQSVWDFLISGGPVMIPLGLCSIAALALTMDRLHSLKLKAILPKGTKSVVDLVKQGDFDKALLEAQELKAPAGRILEAGIRRKGYPLQDIEKAMEDQGGKEVDRLRANIRGLTMIANIAPLLGLLGTVIGIAEAFHRVVKTGLGKPQNLAAGIEVALTTTITGLIIAIPVMLIASFLGGRLRKFMIRTEEELAPAVVALAPEEKAESHAA